MSAIPSTSPRGPALLRRTSLAAALAVSLSALLPVRGARAQDAAPTLQLKTGSHRVTAEKYGRGPIYLDLGVYVAAADGPFELWVTRPEYAQPVQVAQRVPKGNKTELVPLPGDILAGWDGLVDFLEVDFERDGELLKSKSFTFCPNSYDRQRVSDEGPLRTTYPDGCYGNPFTKGLVWGIDEAWAVNATTSSDSRVWLPAGDYDVTVSVADRYVEMFGFEGDTTVEVDLEVGKFDSDCPECPGVGPKPPRRDARRTAAVPPVSDPDDATLPDLVALPAWNIQTRNGRKRELVTFSATVWAAGAQSMVVEGFRRDNADLMDAYQYFYEDGQPVGRARVGEMEFDERDGHDHWHFLQFARYSLLDETKTEIVRSKKEAFCLAPTDTIDLTLPGARWTEDLDRLSTACGGPGALWVREVLPLGYGDTYGQSLPGQAFDITDLPNGTYYVQVTANPLGVLYEQSTENNNELREIVIKGKPGGRRVEVSLWNGIDTETEGGGKG